MHEFMPLEPFLGFLQQTCPINYFRSKTYVLGGFAPFCCRTRPVAGTSIGVQLIECLKILCCLQKLVSRCIYCTSLYLQNHFLFSSNEHAQLLALLKYPFYPLFNFDNGMNLISESLTIRTSAQLLVIFAFAHIFWRYFAFCRFLTNFGA